MELDISKANEYLEEFLHHCLEMKNKEEHLKLILEALNPRYKVIGIRADSFGAMFVGVRRQGVADTCIILDKSTMEENIEKWKSI